MTAKLRALLSLSRIGEATPSAVAADCAWPRGAAVGVLELLGEAGLVGVDRRVEGRVFRLTAVGRACVRLPKSRVRRESRSPSLVLVGNQSSSSRRGGSL